MATQFSAIYNRFLGKITDDMYIELTPEDTLRDLQNLLVNSLPGFEFPKFNVFEYTVDTEVIDKDLVLPEHFLTADLGDNRVVVDNSFFDADLTQEEMNIIALLMMTSWTQRQTTSIENTRMKYSGSDFKMTSQANHLGKLLALLAENQKQSLHMQRLYKRRRLTKDGQFQSNWDVFRQVSAIDN